MISLIKKYISFFQILIIWIFDFYFSLKNSSKVSFIIGVDEIANCTYSLKQVFREDAISVNFNINKYYKSNIYDYFLPTSSKELSFFLRIFYGPFLLAKLANQGDVFIYLWSTGFSLDREIDYKFLKSKQKKIVCIFLGSDIRSLKLQREYGQKYHIDTMATYLEIKNNDEIVKKVAALADKYSDLVFNYSIDQISYLKSNQIPWPYMIDDKLLNKDNNKFSKLTSNQIVVCHAPSNPFIKGTPLVRAVIKKLQIEGYDFKYIEMINIPNSEVLEILEKSHIVLNEFYAFVPGVFSIEAMAKQNAVLTSANYTDISDTAEGAWMPTKYWEIYDHLKYLLDNPEKIEIFALNGHEFVKNNYTNEKVKLFYYNAFLQHGILSDKNTF